MGVLAVGLLLLSVAGTLRDRCSLAAGLVGVGSSVFHPESSRVARMASGGRHGLAQSVFQVGGNIGSSLGPLLAAFLVLPRGQTSVAWCSLVALARRWSCSGRSAAGTSSIARVDDSDGRSGCARSRDAGSVAARVVVRASIVLVALIFSKYFYLASLSSYYTFYLISKFGVSVRSGAARPVHVPRRRGRGHHPRRADRRPLRPQAR